MNHVPQSYALSAPVKPVSYRRLKKLSVMQKEIEKREEIESLRRMRGDTRKLPPISKWEYVSASPEKARGRINVLYCPSTDPRTFTLFRESDNTEEETERQELLNRVLKNGTTTLVGLKKKGPSSATNDYFSSGGIPTNYSSMSSSCGESRSCGNIDVQANRNCPRRASRADDCLYHTGDLRGSIDGEDGDGNGYAEQKFNSKELENDCMVINSSDESTIVGRMSASERGQRSSLEEVSCTRKVKGDGRKLRDCSRNRDCLSECVFSKANGPKAPARMHPDFQIDHSRRTLPNRILPGDQRSRVSKYLYTNSMDDDTEKPSRTRVPESNPSDDQNSC